MPVEHVDVEPVGEILDLPDGRTERERVGRPRGDERLHHAAPVRSIGADP
jgi:hypothetical protein